MDDETQPAAGDTPPILRAILNLAAFHRHHERFYAAAPREQAVTLQRHARTLQALADRWATVPPHPRSDASPFEGADDLTSPVALELDGVLFMEGEGEPAEIGRLRRDLLLAAEDARVTGEWLGAAMEASWEVAAQLIPVDGLADLLGERHRIIANDWQAATMSTLVGRTLRRAVDLLDTVDFSPAALRADIAASDATPGRLLSAAELIDHAADLLSDSAGLVHDNDRRWRTFRARVEQIADDVP